MNYYVCEQNGAEQNALTKAREDVNAILRKLDWRPVRIHRKIEKQNKILHYARMGFWTFWDWHRAIKEMAPDSVLLIQFPMINSLKLNEAAAHKISKAKQEKRIKIIVLIHDVDSLRFPGEKEKQRHHEDVFWELADVIIAHNREMKQYLLAQGIKKPMVELKLFDYLMEKEPEHTMGPKTSDVIIAGNLDGNKAGYLKELKNLADTEFILYGPGYQESMNGKNINYRGVYAPEELPDQITRGWGLVWDGDSTKTCTGGYGEYLRYNNPHKVSFYMAMGMPVIIWERAALASFVREHRVGVTVKNLEEIHKTLEGISEEAYKEIVMNVQKVSADVRGGKFLAGALDACEKV